MPGRLRRRIRLYWPYCHYFHHYSSPPPAWWMERMTPEGEKEALRQEIEILKEELRAAEERIKELGESK